MRGGGRGRERRRERGREGGREGRREGGRRIPPLSKPPVLLGIELRGFYSVSASSTFSKQTKSFLANFN